MVCTFSTFSSYRSYENTKATYFEALLNTDVLEYTYGEIYENIFDKIRYFKAFEYEENKGQGVLKNADFGFQHQEKNNYLS